MLHLLIRMKRLASHPPGWRAVKIGLIALAAVAALLAIEAAGLWPDRLSVERARPPVVRAP